MLDKSYQLLDKLPLTGPCPDNGVGAGIECDLGSVAFCGKHQFITDLAGTADDLGCMQRRNFRSGIPAEARNLEDSVPSASGGGDSGLRPLSFFQLI